MSSGTWIGEPPTPLQAVAVFWLGTTGILIMGLQPLLLGTLAQEGRISSVQLGQAATAEMLLMGASCAAAGARLPAERLRIIGIAAALAYAVLNVLTLQTSGNAVTLVRSLAGIPGGVMIWMTVALITRSPTPARWTGIYLTVQTLAQFLLAAALTAWVVPRYGANGGFTALAVLSVVAAVVALAAPGRFEPLANDQILMTYGENNRDLVLDLLRWLGPGAELIEPKAWRSSIRAELEQMLAAYR